MISTELSHPRQVHVQHCRFSVEVYRFGLRQQLCEIILVRLAEIPEIVPSPRHVGTDMKDYDTLIEGMTGRILSYGSHNTPNELHEGLRLAKMLPTMATAR